MSKIKLQLPSTFSVLATLSILAAAWETWTICNRTPGDTFSATIRGLGKGQPFIIFMLGMLMSHLWRDRMDVFVAGLAAGMIHWPLKDGQDEG